MCLKWRASTGYQEYDTKYLFKINWKENTQYIIQFNIQPTVRNLTNFAIEYTDNTSKVVTGGFPLNQWSKIKIVTDPNKTVKYLRVNYSDGYTYMDLDTFTIEEANSKYEICLTAESQNLVYEGWADDFVNRINSSKATLEKRDNRNCVKFRANAGYGDYDNKYMFKIEWKENTQYTIDLDLFSEMGFGNFSITYTDGTSTFIKTINPNIWNHFNIISDANKTIRYLKVAFFDGYTYLDLDSFIIQEGTKLNYSKTQQNLQLNEPLRAIQCTSTDNYNLIKDERYYIADFIDLERKKVVRRVGEDKLNSEDNWTIAQSAWGNHAFYIIKPSSIKAYSLANCTHLKYHDAHTTIELENQIAIGQGSLIISNKNINTVAELKNWIASNNIKFQYELANPIEEDIEIEDNLIISNNYCKIYADTEIEPLALEANYNCKEAR